MTTPEPAIRLIDLNDYRMVVLFDTAGHMQIGVHGMCKSLGASLLRALAARLDAEHPAFPCDWDPARDEPAAADRPDEPLPTEGARLDADRRVWTDGTGHRWDLSVPWRDVVGVTWTWVGRMDGRGTPLMRADDGAEVEPLDLIRAVTGPIAPAGEGE
ncbi:phiSA1p31-related protein [Streptomyces sp. NPDC101115]|uniref:phiSA1p31-related protein n=1 Tax=Streptomyces sp. NPDC101115 TaxID=3366106 RepID=UPI00380A1A8A